MIALCQKGSSRIKGSAQNEREHFAAKLASTLGPLDLTGYFFYDQINEVTYQRIYSEADSKANPLHVCLTTDWYSRV
ncbi:MAG: hypothetical protein OXH01_03790 [Bacteroidetes bacterium]|nr:hypothetical protein [Bacteroidota bacterium]